MQQRSAIILSLGMLQDKVDTSAFIGKLLKKAGEANKEFKFTPELQGKAFGLSEEFNRGLAPELFMQRLTQLLGITMEAEEFWKEWNAMVTIGNIVEKITSLKTFASQNNALIYLNTDTNAMHLEKIATAFKEMKISFDATKNPTLLADIPLYVSCQIGKNRNELVKDICTKIKEKEFKADRTVLILGNPENIKDKNHQTMAKKELELISKWCNDHAVEICLHSQAHSLDETLTQALHASNKPEEIISSPALKS